MRGGLQRFAVRTNTTLVQRLHVVEHSHPQVTRNPESEWEVVVVYAEAETLIVGKTYSPVSYTHLTLPTSDLV